MMENSESQEMYLSAIYSLQKKNGAVCLTDVADERGYSKASAHNAMERLAEAGYIRFYRGKITLTDSGLIKARDIEQKHETLVAALKLLGAREKEAEENACRMEHVITEDVAALLKRYVEQRQLPRDNRSAEEA